MQQRINVNKDKSALFEEIYCEHLHKVQYFAYNYLQDFDSAKSLAQEVFLSIWENWDAIDFEREILPYLLTLSKNRCLNILRQKKVSQKFEDFSKNRNKESLNYLSLLDSSSTSLYSQEVEELLKRTMDKMSPKVRRTFLLNRFQGLKYKDIADIEGVTVKAIEVRIMSALKVLRVKFKGYLHFVLGFLLVIL